MAALSIGSPAPLFDLPGADGKPVRLEDYRGRTVVLYFYPKDATPGCTREACSFQENLAVLKKRGAAVIGVSADSPASHARFAAKHGLAFPLASDESREVLKAYGVWKKKSMYGKTFMGIERTTVIINDRGVVTHIFPKVKVDGHTREVLDALQEMRSR
jgi:peroxiredoxin Q/BCP